MSAFENAKILDNKADGVIAYFIGLGCLEKRHSYLLVPTDTDE